MQQLLAQARRALRRCLARRDGVACTLMSVLRAHLGARTGPDARSMLKAGAGLDCRAIANLPSCSTPAASPIARDRRSTRHRAAAAARMQHLLDLCRRSADRKGEAAQMGGHQADHRETCPGSTGSLRADQQRLLAALGRMADLECLAATRALLRLAAPSSRRFEAAKRGRGAYDFDDLIIRTGELLRDRPRRRLGALQARRRHRASAGGRGAGHEPGAVGDRHVR